MSNAWTGGQYSVFRVLLALWLAADLLRLTLNAATPVGYTLAGVVAVAAVLLALGYHDRPAALVLAAAAIAIVASGGVKSTPHPVLLTAGLIGLPAVLAILHALTMPGPFGSLAARNRADPGGGWRIPPWLFGGFWTVLVLCYLSAAISFLASEQWHLGTALFPADTALSLDLARGLSWLLFAGYLAFAPLAAVQRFRPPLWLTLLLINTVVLPLAGLWPLAVSLALMHLLSFDPGWITPAAPAEPERLYYDGHCGLCHRAVRFVLAEDTAGKRFLLAPLQSRFITGQLSEQQRANLPDSIVVQTSDNRLLTESAAILHICAKLGGFWRIGAMFGRLFPRPMLDAGYRLVARMRHRLFASPSALCPIVPEPLRARFRQ